MSKKTFSEAKLRKLIRQMIREELGFMEPFEERPSFVNEDLREEPPWAFFGEPEPAPKKIQPQPAEWDEWGEPYQPHERELEAPPYISSNKKRKPK